MGTTATLSDDRDVVKRRRLSLAEIPPEDHKLSFVLDYWRAKCRDGLLPARQDIDVIDLRPVIGRTHLIDVAAEDPAQYRIRLYASLTRLERGDDLTNSAIGAYPSVPFRLSLMEDYNGVALTGVPAYHQVVARLDYVPFSYSRLILPLAKDGRMVNLLLVCINPRPFPDLTI